MAEALGNTRCGGVPMAIGVQSDMATPASPGSAPTNCAPSSWRPRSPASTSACIGVSEPGAGSDVAGIRTTARKDGGDYVINGGKLWITNGAQADWMCCLANTSDGSPHRNKSLIIVPMKTKGVTVERKLPQDRHALLGHRADLLRRRARAAASPDRTGSMGFTYQMLQFQEERLWGAANAIKAWKMPCATRSEYTRGRKIFGRPVLDNQVVHFTARGTGRRDRSAARTSCIARRNSTCPGRRDPARLDGQLKAGRLTREVADKCLQYWVAWEYTWENPVSRLYRDGRLASIGGGADEVMLSILWQADGHAAQA